MKNIVLSIITLTLTSVSCSLFHFLPPALNNSYWDNQFSRFLVLENITSPDQFDIGMDWNDSISIAVTTNGTLSLYAYDIFNYYTALMQDYPGPASSPVMHTDKDFGLGVFYVGNADAGEMKYKPGNYWTNFSTQTEVADCLFPIDYCVSPDGKVFLVFSLVSSNTEFIIEYSDDPGSAGFFNFLPPVDTMSDIIDLTIGIRKDGVLFVGVANNDYIVVYTVDTNKQLMNFQILDGKHAAKVTAAEDGKFYLVYLTKNYDVKMARFEIIGGNLVQTYEWMVYEGGVLVDPSYPSYSIDTVYDPVSGNGYIGFIESQYNQPLLFRFYRGQLSLVNMIHSESTNNKFINLSFDMDGNPVAGVTFGTNPYDVWVYTKWESY
ncbi:MAG: hypothetical protein A2Y33_14780 [Spirochaetes bacterium GWF1_51_8]|nr:MAG: hypothetical protein A2Y33_14780 [Spirochaetes bacterium GWF1_51_8]